MKYLLKSFTVLLLFISYASTTEAQIFDKLKEKVENKIENKAEQKIDAELEKAADRMVEDSWDTVFGAPTKNGKTQGDTPFSFSSNVNTEDVYNFDIVATMKIRSEDTDGESEPPMYMDMHFKDGAQYTGTKFRGNQMQQTNGDLFIIYDVKNSAMVMLMNSDDRKFSYAYDWQQAIAAAEEMSDDTSNKTPEQANWDEADEWNGYQKIGQKNIAGLNCKGYRLKNEQTTTEVWVNHENRYGMGNLFQANTNAKQMKGKLPENYPHGMLMEMTATNNETGEKTFMQIIDIRKNANVSYTMADYPAMKLGKK